jgi:lysophospholipase
VVVVPGRAEPFLNYCELVYDLRDTGYDFYLMDHRGQGFSERLLDDPYKGYVESFMDYVDDLESFMDTVVQLSRYERKFVVAHSMGGGIATRYAELYGRDLTGLVLSAPMHQIDTSPFSEAIARLISGAATVAQNGTEYAAGQEPPDPDPTFEEDVYTHSEARFVAKVRIKELHPELTVAGATYRWVSEALAATATIRADAQHLTLPVLLFQAGDDRIVDNGGQDEVCSKAPHCTKTHLPGAYHEILQERDSVRDVALKAIRELLRAP